MRYGEKGVTLLEVLTTLLILSMLGTIALQALRLGSRSWEKGERRAEVEQRVRVVYGILAQELASVLPISAKVDGKPVTAFRGGPDWILFHSAPDGHGTLPFGAMVKSLAYAVEPGKGLLVRESYPLVEGEVSLDPRGSAKLLDSQVSRLTLRYLAPPAQGETEPRWVEAWDPRETPGETRAGAPPPARQGLPLAVEVTITMAEDRAERTFGFLVPIRVGRTL